MVAPSTPYDVKGLLKSSLRDNNPVIFLEHKGLYNLKGMIPEGEYLVPLGEAKIQREGKDITVVAISKMVGVALQAAEILAKEESPRRLSIPEALCRSTGRPSRIPSAKPAAWRSLMRLPRCAGSPGKCWR